MIERQETERMRLAACGVVATANTPESAAKARDMLPQYRSGSCEEAEKAVDQEVALRDRVEQLEAENAEWKEKAKVWMASPEAAEQLDGYRELGAKVAALEAKNSTLRGHIAELKRGATAPTKTSDA